MKTDFIKDMAEVQEVAQKFDNLVDLSEQSVSLAFSPVFNTFYKCFDIAVKGIASKYEISYESLNWFIWDNKFGGEGFSCIKDEEGSKEVTINDSAAFWDFEKN